MGSDLRFKISYCSPPNSFPFKSYASENFLQTKEFPAADSCRTPIRRQRLKMEIEKFLPPSVLYAHPPRSSAAHGRI